MSSRRFPAFSKVLTAAVAVVLPAAFLLSLPWLRTQPDGLVYLFAGLAALGTVGASLLLAVIKDREIDEFHREGERFSIQWGWLSGSASFAILMAVPVVQDLVIAAAAAISGIAAPDKKLVLLTFMAGFVAVLFMQTICTIAFSLLWHGRMARSDA